MLTEKKKAAICIAISKRAKQALKASKVKAMTFETTEAMYEYLKTCKLQNKVMDIMCMNACGFDDLVDTLVDLHLCKDKDKAKLRILRHVAKDSEAVTIARRNMIELSA